MAKQVDIKAKGLYGEGQNWLSLPSGAFLNALNCLISKNEVKVRRGFNRVYSTKRFSRLFLFRDTLLGWVASTGLLAKKSSSWVFDDFATPMHPAGTLPLRGVEAGGALYFTDLNGPMKLDSLDGVLIRSGVPAATELDAAITATDGTAVGGNSQIAYRSVFGYRDLNDKLCLGAPSGRRVLIHGAVISLAGQTQRTTNVVTVNTVTNHGFTNGQNVYLHDGDTDFPAGLKTSITVNSATQFTYAETAGNATSRLDMTFSNAVRDVGLTIGLPPGLDASRHFVQLYRSQPTINQGIEPNDELGLVYEGAIPPLSQVSTIARTTNVVTVVTTGDHGYEVGDVVKLPIGLVTGDRLVAVAQSGTGAGTSTTDGDSWVSQTGQSASWNAICWDGTYYIAAGASGKYERSTDGVTWADVSSGTVENYAIATGKPGGVTRTVATGYAFLRYTDNSGTSWLGRPFAFGRSHSFFRGYGIIWTGSQYVAVGTTNLNQVDCQTSGDGLTWTQHNVGSVAAGGTLYTVAVTQSGTLIAAGSSKQVWRSTDGGLSWTRVRDPDSGNFRASAIVKSSGRIVLVGDSHACFTSDDDGLTWASRTMPGTSTNWVGLAATATKVVALSSAGEGANSTDGASWVSRTTVNSVAYLAFNGNTIVAPGFYTVTEVPSSTSFKFASTGSDQGATSSPQTVTPVAMYVKDVTPSSFVGAALYTNPSQEGIASSNHRPPACDDVAFYKDTLFFAAPTPLPTLSISLLGCGSPSGVQSGDRISIGTAVATAGSSEDVYLRQFKVFTSDSDLSMNIKNTAESLIRVVNRNASSFGCVLIDNSDSEGVPGVMLIQSLSAATPAYFNPSRATAWSPASATTKSPKKLSAVVAYSKPGQPDATPLAYQTAVIGSSDAEIIRIQPTRSALFVLKSDGIYILTGSGPPWQVEPFDLSTVLRAPETVQLYQGGIFAVCDAGPVMISDTGVTPIGDQLKTIWGPFVQSLQDANVFAVADEPADLVYLWLGPTLDRGWVYDGQTGEWAGSIALGTLSGIPVHGIPGPTSALYLTSTDSVSLTGGGTSGGLSEERRNLALYQQRTNTRDSAIVVTQSGTQPDGITVSFTGFAAQVGDVVETAGGSQAQIIAVTGGPTTYTATLDRTWTGPGNGLTFTLYQGIDIALLPAPYSGKDASAINRYREFVLSFRSTYFPKARFYFYSDIDGFSGEYAYDVSLYDTPFWNAPRLAGTLVGAPATGFLLRSIVPIGASRGRLMTAGFTSRMCLSEMALELISVIFNPGPSRAGR